jgi:hypothetical protein
MAVVVALRIAQRRDQARAMWASIRATGTVSASASEEERLVLPPQVAAGMLELPCPAEERQRPKGRPSTRRADPATVLGRPRQKVRWVLQALLLRQMASAFAVRWL